LVFEHIRAARFAPVRGHAMLQLDERRLVVIDLRFGRPLKEWSEASEVVDFSVDLTARGLVLRRRGQDGGTEIFFGSYRDLLGPTAGRGGAVAAAPRTAARSDGGVDEEPGATAASDAEAPAG